MMIIVKQEATGGRAVSIVRVKFVGGAAWTPAMTANARSQIVIQHDGTQWNEL